jgi:two-component system, NtrC family, sensor kinase
MRCPRCQHENRPQATFCEECASPTARSYADPKSEVESFRQALTEALEQQTATAEILRVIASSPTDLQPVFETILARAVRLCGAEYANLFRFDGERQHFVTGYNTPAAMREAHSRQYPMVPARGRMSGRAILERRIVHVPDLLAEPEYQGSTAVVGGFRSNLAVPMMREGEPIGVIVINRMEPGPFSDKQISVVATFADQAVIAIENVRLFTELERRNRDLTEALEQQTATAEILRVISSSPTDLQPVMKIVAGSAARFCGAHDVGIWRLEEESLRLVAGHGPMPWAPPIGGTVAISSQSVVGRVVLDRQTIHIEDFRALPETEFPESVARVRSLSFPVRTILATPLLREGVPIGVIYMRRSEVEPFTDKQIELAKTFAAQAVIAIENVRLFHELQTRNAELTESLEQQTATSEILRAISGSPTDVQPVFDTIAANALRLCGAKWSAVTRFDGQLIELVSLHGVSDPGALEALHRAFPRPPSRAGATDRAVLTRAVAYVPRRPRGPRVPVA